MRTREQIDQEYAQVVLHYGDNLVKSHLFAEDARRLFERANALNKELGEVLKAESEKRSETAPPAESA
jgi:hypothetical protein